MTLRPRGRLAAMPGCRGRVKRRLRTDSIASAAASRRSPSVDARSKRRRGWSTSVRRPAKVVRRRAIVGDSETLPLIVTVFRMTIVAVPGPVTASRAYEIRERFRQLPAGPVLSVGAEAIAEDTRAEFAGSSELPEIAVPSWGIRTGDGMTARQPGTS